MTAQNPASPDGELVSESKTIDAAVSRCYRRFKDWSNRKFNADDVTWCEVRADLIEIATAIASSAPRPDADAKLVEIENTKEELSQLWAHYGELEAYSKRREAEIATLRSQLAEAREIIKPFAEARTYAKDRDGKPLKVFGINPSEVDYQRAKEFYDRALSPTTPAQGAV